MMRVIILQTIKGEYKRLFMSMRNNYTTHCSNEIEILSFTVPERVLKLIANISRFSRWWSREDQYIGHHWICFLWAIRLLSSKYVVPFKNTSMTLKSRKRGLEKICLHVITFTPSNTYTSSDIFSYHKIHARYLRWSS